MADGPARPILGDEGVVDAVGGDALPEFGEVLLSPGVGVDQGRQGGCVAVIVRRLIRADAAVQRKPSLLLGKDATIYEMVQSYKWFHLIGGICRWGADVGGGQFSLA
jgi:hypothetical protein